MDNQLIKTPFDQIILELAQENFENPTIIKPTSNLVLQQLHQLRTVYLLMKEVDFYTKTISQPLGTRSIPLEEAVLQNPFDSYKVYLNYFLFLTIINQSYRAIKKHLPGKEAELPDYKKIKFYRDKVVEHWEEYIMYLNGRGTTFQKDKIAIPTIEQFVAPNERQQLRDQVITEFNKRGLKIEIEDTFLANMISSNPVYSDLIYGALEKLDSNFHESHDKYKSIIDLLFKFGFPAPICDVQGYSENFVKYTKTILLARLLERSI